MNNITFKCSICGRNPCEEWCSMEKYEIPVCGCGKELRELGLVEDIDTEHGHISDIERNSLYVCEQDDCKFYRIVYFLANPKE